MSHWSEDCGDSGGNVKETALGKVSSFNVQSDKEGKIIDSMSVKEVDIVVQKE